MQLNNKLRDVAELRAGDVLLCRCDPTKDYVAKQIYDATRSEYCHAAIYYGDSFVAKSTAKNGIKKGRIEKFNVSDLISRYDHIAVVRQPDAWAGDDRTAALKLFIDKVVENQAKYNFKGILKFKNRKELHECNIQEKLNSFFDGGLAPS